MADDPARAEGKFADPEVEEGASRAGGAPVPGVEAGGRSRGELGGRGGVCQCPLCGTEFDAAGQGCRPSCPLASGCHVVCCPACHYSFPQETGLAARLRRLLERRRGART